MGETLHEEGAAHSPWLAVGVTILIALFLCLPPLWAVRWGWGGGGGGVEVVAAALRPCVTRPCSRSGQLEPGTETISKCLLN